MYVTFCTVNAIHNEQYMKQSNRHGHETVAGSISTYQFLRLHTAVVYILSLECLTASIVGPAEPGRGEPQGH